MASEFNNNEASAGNRGKQRLASPVPNPSPQGGAGNALDNGSLEFILDVPLEIAVELGRTKLFVNDLLKLCQGSVIELTKFAGETLDIMANQKLIAKGEVVVTNEKYGVRLTEIVTPAERIERLK